MPAVFKTSQVELRLGRWQDVLADVKPDAVIADPPYSDGTHDGWNAGADQVRDATGQRTRQGIEYEATSMFDLGEIVGNWSKVCRGWTCYMTDDILAPSFRMTAYARGRYAFAPVPIIQKRPRLLGDGPASWCVYLMVSRPRTKEFSRWGCLPGLYESHCESIPGIVGVKPVKLMRAIVRDYTRPGDLVVDTHAGSGSTLIAAAAEGRRAIGAERNPETFEIAVERLREGPLLERLQPDQGGLFDAT